MIRELRQQVARRTGIWVGRAASLRADHHLAALAGRLNVDCVLDVGANRGQFGREIRAAGYEGPIVSFEPVPEAFAQLAELTADDRAWSIRQVALSDEAGTLPINVSQSTSVSSFMTIRDDYVARHPPGQVARVAPVTVTTLDAETIGLPYRRMFLKTDTQGYDLKVLRGASDTLRRVVGLQIELSTRPIYDDAPDFVEALGAVRDLGFRLSGMFPIPSDPIVEFDGVFVRV